MQESLTAAMTTVYSIGDVHCGGHSEILKDQEILFRQLTTSAIANEPLPKTAYYFMRAAGRFGFLQDGYSFRHHKWTRACNYGLVQVKYHSLQVHLNSPLFTYQIVKICTVLV